MAQTKRTLDVERFHSNLILGAHASVFAGRHHCRNVKLTKPVGMLLLFDRQRADNLMRKGRNISDLANLGHRARVVIGFDDANQMVTGVKRLADSSSAGGRVRIVDKCRARNTIHHSRVERVQSSRVQMNAVLLRCAEGRSWQGLRLKLTVDVK